MSGSQTYFGATSQIPGTMDVSYRQDNLIAGSFQLVTDSVTLKGGQDILRRGTVLGKTSDNKFVLSLPTAGDGSQTPIAILADTYDTTAGDVVGAGVYLTGEFNEQRLITGTGWTIETLKSSLRPASIFLKNTLTADDPT